MTVAALCEKHNVELVAIGNGTASRETERFYLDVQKQFPKVTAQKVIVSEAGASVYSASELAAQEFPDLDVSLRGAVSIARRLQDPLAELVKIDPKSIGVGQYQHDVSQTQLARKLDAVVEAINIGGALQPLFDVGSVALFVHGIQWIGYTLHFPDWLTIFLAQGLGGGINTVLPLVPQIGMMYLFLSFLEDSGYMARAAFVMDRLMQALGLPGKSFVPLIVGFGCNVPSVMGARTLDAPRSGYLRSIRGCLLRAERCAGGLLAVYAGYCDGGADWPDAQVHHHAR